MFLRIVRLLHVQLPGTSELLYGSPPALSNVGARRNISPESVWSVGNRLMRMCSSGLPDRRETAKRGLSLPTMEPAGGQKCLRDRVMFCPKLEGRKK